MCAMALKGDIIKYNKTRSECCSCDFLAVLFRGVCNNYYNLTLKPVASTGHDLMQLYENAHLMLHSKPCIVHMSMIMHMQQIYVLH